MNKYIKFALYSLIVVLGYSNLHLAVNNASTGQFEAKNSPIRVSGELLGNAALTGPNFFRISSGSLTVTNVDRDFYIGDGTASTSSGASVSFGVDNKRGTITFRGINYTFPSNDGDANQVLHSNGSGTLSWDTDDSGGSSTFTGLDFGVFGGTAVKITSMSFAPNAFDLANTASEGFVYLDYTNGPASRSLANTWSALNIFSVGASFSDTAEITRNGTTANLFKLTDSSVTSTWGLNVNDGDFQIRVPSQSFSTEHVAISVASNTGGVTIGRPGKIVRKGTISGSGSPNFLDQPDEVYISGHYAYIAAGSGTSSDDSLVIVDITNPASPTFEGRITHAQYTPGMSNVVVQGTYAYYTADDAHCFGIIDVKNPSAPLLVSTICGSAGHATLDAPDGLYVAGKYAYVVSSDGATFVIIDISDAQAPTIVGSYDDNTNLAGVDGLACQGNYCYLAAEGANLLVVMDISNKTKPKRVGTVTVSGANNVHVSGKYVYIASYAGDALSIVDVSNPTAPVVKGSLSGAGSPNYLDQIANVWVSGKYAYAVSEATDAMTVIDISNPTAPTRVATYLGGAGANSMDLPKAINVSGRYAYITSQADDRLTILDLGGLETPLLQAGSIAATQVNISDDLDVFGNAFFNGGLGVGPSGILTNGPLGISLASLSNVAASTSTDSMFRISHGKGYFTGDTMRIDMTASTSSDRFGGNFAKFTVSGNNYIILGSGGEIVASGAAQFGGTSSVAYSRFGTGTTGHALDAANDLIISDDFEVDGNSFFDGGASFSASVTGTLDTLVRFGATSAVPPSSSFATFDTRNDFTVLDFGDSAVASKSIFIDTMPYDYDDGTVTVYIHYSATSATSGDVVWDVQFERVGDGSQDIDTGGWNTAETATCTVPGTSGFVDICSMTFTQAQMDGVKKGELFRMRVIRDTTDAADTVTATDIELHSVLIRQ